MLVSLVLFFLPVIDYETLLITYYLDLETSQRKTNSWSPHVRLLKEALISGKKKGTQVELAASEYHIY